MSGRDFGYSVAGTGHAAAGSTASRRNSPTIRVIGWAVADSGATSFFGVFHPRVGDFLSCGNFFCVSRCFRLGLDLGALSGGGLELDLSFCLPLRGGLFGESGGGSRIGNFLLNLSVFGFIIAFIYFLNNLVKIQVGSVSLKQAVALTVALKWSRPTAVFLASVFTPITGIAMGVAGLGPAVAQRSGGRGKQDSQRRKEPE